MKKIGFFLMFMLVAGVFLACDSDDDQVVPSNELPQAAQVYVQTHFPDNAVASVKKEDDGGYDVVLEGSYELDFDVEGNIESVEGRSALPDSVIPDAVLSYVHANYPDAHILEWDRDALDQEVKLNSGVELVFDLEGQFLRVDN